MNFMDARDACYDLHTKAKLLTLDGLHETFRFTKEFNDTEIDEQNLLTSGLFFQDEWHWMGGGK